MSDERDATVAAMVLKGPQWIAHQIGVKAAAALCTAGFIIGVGIGAATMPADDHAAAPTTTTTTAVTATTASTTTASTTAATATTVSTACPEGFYGDEGDCVPYPEDSTAATTAADCPIGVHDFDVACYAHADDWDLDNIRDDEDPNVCMPPEVTPVSVPLCDENGHATDTYADEYGNPLPDEHGACPDSLELGLTQYDQPICAPPSDCDEGMAPIYYDTELAEWSCGGGM